MHRRLAWPVAAGLAAFLVVTIGTLTLIPQWLYPRLSGDELQAVTGADNRIQLQQAQSQLQNNARATLLQAIAGLLVVAGAIATWRQVQINREGPNN